MLCLRCTASKQFSRAVSYLGRIAIALEKQNANANKEMYDMIVELRAKNKENMEVLEDGHK